MELEIEIKEKEKGKARREGIPKETTTAATGTATGAVCDDTASIDGTDATTSAANPNNV